MARFGPKPRPAIERLLARIEVSETGCWIWPGALNEHGYGKIKGDQGRGWRFTHVVTWEHYNGPIERPLEPDHRCRVTACCNPDHLEIVTSAENHRRGQLGSRSLVCARGHWVLGDNAKTTRGSRGKIIRTCRTCANEKARRNYALRRAA